MKKFKKTFKGMTLAEIIISLAVLSVMTLLLVTISASINSFLKSANNVNNKVARQAPAAEVGYVDAARRIDDDVTISVEYNGSLIKIKGEAYSVEDRSNIKHSGEDGFRPGDSLEMKFIKFNAVTTAPTTTPVVPTT